jgi:phage-related protein
MTIPLEECYQEPYVVVDNAGNTVVSASGDIVMSYLIFVICPTRLRDLIADAIAMTVRNQRSYLREKFRFVTPDGAVLELNDPPARAVLSAEGFGMLPISQETTRGPYQHGTTLLGVRGEPRQITLLIRFNGCSRNNYWDLRDTLNSAFRPNRTNMNNPIPGTLYRHLYNGQIRAIDVVRASGLNYPPRDGWDEFSVQDTIDFVATNPIFYDPTPVTEIMSDFSPIVTANASLTFPMTFPFTLGVPDQTRVTKTEVITYTGDWEEYPFIVVTGPGENLRIVNSTTGIEIFFENYVLDDGETITINLSYDNKSAVSSKGYSVLGWLTDESKIELFSIQPDPIAAGGVNTIEITIENGSVNSEVELTYYKRYASV